MAPTDGAPPPTCCGGNDDEDAWDDCKPVVAAKEPCSDVYFSCAADLDWALGPAEEADADYFGVGGGGGGVESF
jgi:hypothetical protein